MSHDDDKSWFDAHKDLICDTIHQKTWITTISGTKHPKFVMILLVSTINPQTNISNMIFILANGKHNYGTFEADYITVYYWILFPPAHVQQILFSPVILYM